MKKSMQRTVEKKVGSFFKVSIRGKAPFTEWGMNLKDVYIFIRKNYPKNSVISIVENH